MDLRKEAEMEGESYAHEKSETPAEEKSEHIGTPHTSRGGKLGSDGESINEEHYRNLPGHGKAGHGNGPGGVDK